MDYGKALQLALQFYEAQKTGAKGANPLVWRGDSFLTDGQSIGVDLSKGFSDAGDTVKFALPMGSAFALIGWSLLKFSDGYKQVKEYDHAVSLFRYAVEFMIACHTAPDELVVQIGDGNADHAYWGPSETQQLARPVYKVNAIAGGSDVAHIFTVNLAIASLLFQSTDPTFSQLCYTHATQLYAFGVKYPALYSKSVPQAAAFYVSSSYQDELMFASLWMYKLETSLNNTTQADYYKTQFTQNNTFLLTATLTWTYCWDDCTYGALVLASELFPTSIYGSRVEKWLDFWIDSVPKTPSGISWLTQWGVLRYTSNTCLMALLYYQISGKTKYQQYAISQIQLILGRNPKKFSYLIGFGDAYPLNPHHRNSHGAWAGQISIPTQNRHLLIGALIGGPDQNDVYTDDRTNYVVNEVALDYNAGLTGALAALAGSFPQSFTGLSLPTNTSTPEYEVWTKILYQNTTFVDLQILFLNKTCFPPRYCINPKFIYQSSSLKSIVVNYSNCNAVVNSDRSISTIAKTYEGSEQSYSIEIQLRITSNYTADVSFQGVSTVSAINQNILVFDTNGHLLAGKSAVPTPTPVPSVLPSFSSMFSSLYTKIHANLFTKDGGPWHALETSVIEAPDFGHMSTSEAYSYWILLEVYQSLLTNNTATLTTAFNTLEKHIIPTQADQPTNAFYNASAPATYAPELDTPQEYPAVFDASVKVGADSLFQELSSSYSTPNLYGMHWLVDCDNVYKFGNRGDGISTPSYVNTFQRGRMEGVWDTVPQPSWETFKWGSVNGSATQSSAGYLPLFTSGPYAKQWRYTNAPDADARVVQSIYKLLKLNPSLASSGFTTKAKQMGDCLRYCMFDKYFKPIGCQNKNAVAVNPRDACHQLMSWYYAWGGSIDTNGGWAWRIGCSHTHFGYQNPIAAYALSNELAPVSATAKSDWTNSLARQIAFYKWLQSSEGLIAGGATNSFNGRYESYPTGTPTFYGMAYQQAPVFNNPDSNLWIGWQMWSIQRVAEYYYTTKDSSVLGLLKKWVTYMLANSTISANTLSYPLSIAWTGAPNTFDPTHPDNVNTNLHVSITQSGHDIGTAAAFAKILMLYAKAVGDVACQNSAKTILEFIWTWCQTDSGLAVQSLQDFSSQTGSAHIPLGFTGTAGNGAQLNSSATFMSLRPFYNSTNLPMKTTMTYHRFWEQCEIATAFLEYDILFNGAVKPVVNPTTSIVPPSVPPVVPSVNPYIVPFTTDFTITTYTLYGTITVSISNKTMTYTPTTKPVKQDQLSYIEGGVAKIAVFPVPAIVVPPTSSSYTPSLDQENYWQNGFVYSYKFTNTTLTTISNWKIHLVIPSGVVITGAWNISMIGNDVYSAMSYNATIAPQQSVEFGIQGSYTVDRKVGISLVIG